MASESLPEKDHGYWEDRWKENQIGFHNPEVNRLADKGLTVVGIDCVRSALEQFYEENGLTFTEERIKDGFQVLKSEDGKIRLYCGDALKFDETMEGKFDAIYDRAAFVALERSVLPRYIKNVKNLLSPGGHLYLEMLEYDLSIMKDLPDSPTKPPPPYPMYETEVKPLFEEDHTVELLDRQDRQVQEKDVQIAVYLITQK